MGLDRAATLRDAEKLLRQGKLDLAIAEYVRVLDEFPRDWHAGNIIGDLYVRAGQQEHLAPTFVARDDLTAAAEYLPADICLALQAEAGDYRDVAARVDRLAQAQTRG